MSDILKYPRGTCLVLTSGCYSSFGLSAILVTIKDCDLPTLAQMYAKSVHAKATAEKDIMFELEPTNFPSWLVANGYAMPADAQTVHLGDYGKFEDEFGVPENLYEIDDEVEGQVRSP